MKLSTGVFFFGLGGVTRFEENKEYKNDGKRSDYLTALYAGQSKVAIAKESLDEILLKLEGKL